MSKKQTLAPIMIQFPFPNFDGPKLVSQLQSQGLTANLLKFYSKQTTHTFTYISLHEYCHLTLKNHRLIYSDALGTKLQSETLKTIVTQLLTEFKITDQPQLPPFFGGFIGYFSYDYARYANSILPQNPQDPFDLADADLSFVDQTFIYDHQSQQAYLVQLRSPKTTATATEILATLNKLKQQLLTLAPSVQPLFQLKTPFQLAFDQKTFTEKVAQAKAHIYDGDIFQLILANRQQAKMQGRLLGIAEDFFSHNATPYQFYYQHGDFEAIGASPETLVTKNQKQLFTYPLAGTRRRGRTPAEETKFSTELQTDAKEIAEHNMLVDLGRNDLGQVSQFGSVQVTKLRQLLKFSQVMHLGSTIESTVAKGITSMQIIEALMPAGTLSGAPKMAAMTIINQLEAQKRGLYGGCLGYISPTGDLDLCIGIRLAYRQKDNLFVHSGAGIVADSQPDKEYLEFNNKARAIMLALTRKEVVADALSH